MMDVMQRSLVSQMSDHAERARISAELGRYVRLEYGGDGAEVRRILAEARRRGSRGAEDRQGRGVLSALAHALGSAISRSGGA